MFIILLCPHQLFSSPVQPCSSSTCVHTNCSLPRYNHVHHPLVSLPIVFFPGTTMFIILLCLSQLFSSPVQPCSSSSCVHTNCNLFCLRNVDIWHTLASFRMTWFLTWSFLVLPLIHRSILISSTCNTMLSSYFLTAQHSSPYIIVGLITGFFVQLVLSFA